MVTLAFLHGPRVFHKHLINPYNLRMPVKLFLFTMWECSQNSTKPVAEQNWWMGVPGSWVCSPISALLILNLSMDNSLFRVVNL